MIRTKTGILCDITIDLDRFKTYPPLADYNTTYLENLHLKRKPDRPVTVDEKHDKKFQLAYTNQCAIGWDNFLRGLISTNWRYLQHTYFLEQKNRDMYAVDKCALDADKIPVRNE